MRYREGGGIRGGKRLGVGEGRRETLGGRGGEAVGEGRREGRR